MKFEIAPKSTEIVSNWDDARFYCFSLSIDGKSGWRLPTKKELHLLIILENDFHNDYYWTNDEWGDVSVWVQKGVAYRGIYHQFHAHRESKNKVRAVRVKR
jgi:hypothetical protein